jgi:putative peptidoglycan lipid II flippase
VSEERVVAGLMLVTSLTYVAGWVLGHVVLRRRLGVLETRATLLPVLRTAAVAVAAGLLGWLAVSLTDGALGASVAGSLVTVLLGTVVIGVATLVGLVVARAPEVREPLAAVRARLGRRG